jgi:hypothetical protein
MSRRSSLLLAIMLAPALATTAAAPAFAAPAKHAQHVTHKKKAPPHKKAAKPAKPAKLTCRAAMSNGRPYQFTTTRLIVTTAGGALVQATAHYLTTSVPEAALASKQGTASIPFYISWSTPWYRVNMNVQVSQGSRTASCSTSFTPRVL